ncbi:glyoxalase, partial [Streptomyces umbrinus]
GVTPEGSGSHRLTIGGGTETFTDPDGFAWEPAAA